MHEDETGHDSETGKPDIDHTNARTMRDETNDKKIKDTCTEW